MIPKFRAWDRKNKVMRDVKGLIWEETDLIGHCNLIAHCPPRGHEFNEWFTVTLDGSKYQLMQSTGFKDNNDTEVFEGDVINIHWFYADFDPVELGAFENEGYAERVIVKKEFGNFGFWWEEADSWVDLATLAMSARLDEESFEILGNIYENPELASLGF